MGIVENKKILFDIYKVPENYLHKSNYNKKISAKALLERYSRKLDRLLLIYMNPKVLDTEKIKNLKTAKSTYRKLSIMKMNHPELMSFALMQKIEDLVGYLAQAEAECIDRYERIHDIPEGINLEHILKDMNNCRELILKPIEKFLDVFEEQMEKKIENNIQVYMTAKGSKYHLKDCKYCKGRALKKFWLKDVSDHHNACKCIATLDNGAIKEIYEQIEEDSKKEDANTVTIFVDESVRTNPWVKYEAALKTHQASYSYIICKGKLLNESEIRKNNLLKKHAGIAENTCDNTAQATFDGITSALAWLKFEHGFRGNVVIYVDNMSVVSKWEKSILKNNAEELFKAVTIYAVPRDQNKRADAVGRAVAFFDIPADLMNEIYKRTSEYDKLEKKLQRIEEFFPDPEKQIPNLIEELQLVAAQIEGVITI